MAANRHAHEGLYDPAYEHDACGVAFVANLAGRRDHDVAQKARTALRNLEHRGEQGSTEGRVSSGRRKRPRRESAADVTSPSSSTAGVRLSEGPLHLDQQTIGSFKRTLNAAILIRASQPSWSKLNKIVSLVLALFLVIVFRSYLEHVT